MVASVLLLVELSAAIRVDDVDDGDDSVNCILGAREDEDDGDVVDV